jgi:hypothetical protein
MKKFFKNIKLKRLKKSAAEVITLSPLLIIMLLLSTQFIQDDLEKYKEKMMNLEINEYYFESFVARNELTILVNKKPVDVEIYCFNKNLNRWVKKDLIFYTNAIGYKAETRDRDCLNKIKIKKGKTILYYKNFEES